MIKFTDSALSKVKEMNASSESGKILRIFIEPGGCSGFEYGMSLDVPKPSDEVSEYSEYGGGRGSLHSARSEYSEYGPRSARGDAPRSARRRYEPQAPPRTPRETALEDENEYLREQLAAAEARGVKLREESYSPRRRRSRRDDRDRRRSRRDRDYEDDRRRRRSRRRRSWWPW